MGQTWRWMGAAVAAGLVGTAQANNVSIANVALVNVTNGTAEIQFDVSWEHSWRYDEMVAGGTVTNHDAVWVFAKYRAGGEWRPVLLADTGHLAAAGTILTPASNGSGAQVGAFVLRDGDGHGALTATGVRLRWDYVRGGLTGTNGVDISVHGIEMVYIPEGPFYLGSGGPDTDTFYEYPEPALPYQVASEDAIEVGATTGSLYYAAVKSGGDRGGPIPADFPKGYQAFYCMKYEITQGQYAHFLNRLPAGVDGARFPNAYGANRNTLWLSNGVYVADAPDRACNYLDWADVTTYLDWAGLRPMTELEYEKACRGPLYPIPGEYAWGDTTYTAVTSLSGTDGSGSETASPATANCHIFRCSGLTGPVRAGLFATASSTRHEAGAGYYGVMELTGNLYERAVSAGVSAARSFRPVHGDGDVSTPVPEWGAGSIGGLRGGSHACNPVGVHPVSSRYYAAYCPTGRDAYMGGRGVRSAP